MWKREEARGLQISALRFVCASPGVNYLSGTHINGLVYTFSKQFFYK